MATSKGNPTNFDRRHRDLEDRGWDTINRKAGHYLLSPRTSYSNRTTSILKFVCSDCPTAFETTSFLYQKSADGKRCQKCKRKHRVTDNASRQEFISRCRLRHGAKFNYDLLPATFTKTQDITVVCDIHGPIITSAYTHVNGAGCVQCSLRTSKGVVEIIEALRILDIDYTREHLIPIRGQAGRSRLRLDFWIPSKNLAIEYDGEHHFRPIQFKGNSDNMLTNFNRQRRNDGIKTQYCADVGIELLRIPYTDPTPGITVQLHLRKCK